MSQLLLNGAVGAVAFVCAHVIQTLTWQWFASAHEPWFLNSGRAGAVTAAFLFFAGAIVGGFSGGDPLRLGASVGGGAAVAALVVLLWQVGPGNLFPIVIVIGTIVLMASSCAGSAAGWMLKRLPKT